MPLLARMLLSPLFIDIRAGAVSGLGDLLSDRRISADGHVAVAVGPGQGEAVVEAIQPALSNADVFTVARRQPRGGRRAAGRAARARTTTRWSASAAAAPSTSRSTPPPGWRCRWWRSPPTWPTTASPRRSARCCTRAARARSASACRWPWWSTSTTCAPRRRGWSGPASATWCRNLSAIEDWRLAGRERGEPVDGLAVTFARTAAEAVLHRTDGIESDELPHRARRGAGAVRHGDGGRRLQPAVQRRRPRDPARRRRALPRRRQPRRAGRRRRALLVLPARRRRARPRWSTPACGGTSCRGCRPTSGSRPSSSPRPSCSRPSTRPDRYTILEHLDLDAAAVRDSGGRLRRVVRG